MTEDHQMSVPVPNPDGRLVAACNVDYRDSGANRILYARRQIDVLGQEARKEVIMQFRKRPVVVEAFQWTGNSTELPKWFTDESDELEAGRLRVCGLTRL